MSTFEERSTVAEDKYCGCNGYAEPEHCSHGHFSAGARFGREDAIAEMVKILKENKWLEVAKEMDMLIHPGKLADWLKKKLDGNVADKK